MDPLLPESVAPAAESEDFVHIGHPSVVNLSENMVRIDLPTNATVSPFLGTADSTAESGVCDVYLVGTCHISRESCGEVQEIINFLKPQVVFLELCPGRLTVLAPQNLKIADKLDVFPGAEFHVAYEEALKYGGRVILGDRPAHVEWVYASKLAE